MLMNKPTDDEVRNIRDGIVTFSDIPCQMYYGYELHDCSHHSGKTTWSFPKGIRNKIKDYKLYKVWNIWGSSSDMCDMSTYHKVYYIEECEIKIKTN